MELPEDKKVDVLLAVYNSSLLQVDNIRNRSVTFLLWACGIFLFLSGFVLKNDASLGFSAKVSVSLLLLTTFLVFEYQLFKLSKGFERHLGVISKVEEMLNLYEEGAFFKGSVLPESKKGVVVKSSFIRFMAVAVGLVFSVSLFAIWCGSRLF